MSYTLETHGVKIWADRGDSGVLRIHLAEAEGFGAVRRERPAASESAPGCGGVAPKPLPRSQINHKGDKPLKSQEIQQKIDVTFGGMNDGYAPWAIALAVLELAGRVEALRTDLHSLRETIVELRPKATLVAPLKYPPNT
jgi:hypothetical protein